MFAPQGALTCPPVCVQRWYQTKPARLAPPPRSPYKQVLKRKVPPYVPDFGAAFEHFCLHSGGRGVLDAVERELRLPAEAVAPSRAALQRFGNTSAASIW